MALGDGVNVGDGFIEIHPELDDAALAALEAKLKAAMAASSEKVKVQLQQGIGDGMRIPDEGIRAMDIDSNTLGARIGKNIKTSSARELKDLGRELNLANILDGSDNDFIGRLLSHRGGGAGSKFVKDFADSVERDGPGRMGKAFQALASPLPGSLEKLFADPAIVAGLAPILVGVASTLALDFAGALTLGIGAVGIGAVLVRSIQTDPQIKSAAKGLVDILTQGLSNQTGFFRDPFLQSFSIIDQAAQRLFVTLGPGFQALAKAVVPLTEGFDRFINILGPSLNRVLISAQPVLEQFAKDLPDVAKALASLFTTFSDNEQQMGFGLHILIDGVNDLLRLLQGLVTIGGFLARIAEQILRFGHDIVDVFSNIGGVVTGNVNKVNDVLNPFKGLLTSIPGIGPSMKDFFDVFGGGAEKSGGQVDKATGSAGNYKTALGGLQTQAQDATDALNKLQTAVDAQISSMDKAYNTQIKVTDTQITFTHALATLDKTLAGTSATLNINTEDGAKNAGALTSAAKAARDHYIAQIEAHVPVEQATADYNRNTEQLKKAAAAAGLSQQETQNLIDTYGQIPKDISTIIALQGADKVKDTMDTLLQKQYALQHGVSIAEATKATSTGGQFQGKASGGRILGPGGPMDDIIPAWLSNGEFVINAAATAANLPLLEAINRGQKFAAGGLFKQRAHANWPFDVDVSKTMIPTPAQSFAALGMGNSGGAAPSGLIGSWIAAAMKYVNIEWPAGVFEIIMRESGGNPNSINLWDSNAMAGTPSIGLMQTIGPTFSAYHDPRLPNTPYDPVANIVAAVNYIHSRYGSIYNVQQAHSEMAPQGYAHGGRVKLFDKGGILDPGMNLVLNATGGREEMTPTGGGTVVNVYVQDERLRDLIRVEVDDSHNELSSVINSGRRGGQ